MHPTVKPVALVADALLDVMKRGELVLDPFGGSGTTLIAAEKTGRVARLIEFDPLYCDVIVRRFEAFDEGCFVLALTALNLLPSIATMLASSSSRPRQSATNCWQTLRMARPLSRRKSAMVLKSAPDAQ